MLGMSPEAYIVFLGAICGFTVLVVGMRFWILRKKLRRPSDWISDVCFVLACLASCANAFICMWKTVKEVEFREAHPEMAEQLITYSMFAPVYLKVSNHPSLISMFWRQLNSTNCGMNLDSLRQCYTLLL